MKRLVVVATAVAIAVTAAPRAARAAGPKFELLCGTFVDGQAKDVLPSAKKPKITGAVGCALRIRHADPDFTALVALRTVRAKKWTTQWLQTDAKPGDDGIDYEWMLEPDARDPAGVPYWQPCEDFDIEVGVDVPSGETIFKKKLHVAQSCPKPKPIVAKVTCTATQQGESWTVPTRKPFRLGEPDAKIACVIAPKAKRAVIGDLAVTGWIEHPADDGSPTQSAKHDADLDPVGEGTYVQYDVTFGADDWLMCSLGTIVLEAKDGDGNVVLSKKIKIDQDCGPD